MNDQLSEQIHAAFGGGWNYRILKFDDGEYYGLCEVYYDKNGKPSAYAEKPIIILDGENGEHKNANEELIKTLDMMRIAAEKDIIDSKDFEK